MLDFRNLLELVGLDPAQTLIVRHAPVEKKLKWVLPWLVAERQDLWLTWQRIQWETLERPMCARLSRSEQTSSISRRLLSGGYLGERLPLAANVARRIKIARRAFQFQ
jgi:hypothetical protein